MMITLFANKNMGGASREVTTSDNDLSTGPIDKPGSITMTSPTDAILLFKNRDWKGGVHYLRGVNSISNLGSSSQGGRNGFGNSIRSVRVQKFTIDVNVSVVKNDAGDLPGSWLNDARAEESIREVFDLANGILQRNRALIHLGITRITFRTSEAHFVSPRGQGVPSSWKAANEANVIFIDRFRKEGTAGRTPLVNTKIMRIAKMLNPKEGPDWEVTEPLMASVLLHELGHYLNIFHASAEGNIDNVMIGSNSADRPGEAFTPDQIRRMHDKLKGGGERSTLTGQKGIGSKR